MHKITDTFPVRTRVPLAAWAVAAAVTLASVMSSLLGVPQASDHARPGAEQGVQPKTTVHQAKV